MKTGVPARFHHWCEEQGFGSRSIIAKREVCCRYREKPGEITYRRIQFIIAARIEVTKIDRKRVIKLTSML